MAHEILYQLGLGGDDAFHTLTVVWEPHTNRVSLRFRNNREAANGMMGTVEEIISYFDSRAVTGHCRPRPIHAQDTHPHALDDSMQRLGLLPGLGHVPLDAALAAVTLQARQNVRDGPIAQTQHVQDYPKAAKPIAALSARTHPLGP